MYVKHATQKELYKKARSGEIKGFTGISAPYEAPQTPEVTVNTAELNVIESALQVIDFLEKNGLVPTAK